MANKNKYESWPSGKQFRSLPLAIEWGKRNDERYIKSLTGDREMVHVLRRARNPQTSIVRDKWVSAKIKVTKAGKILAKVAPAAVTGTKPAKRVVKRTPRVVFATTGMTAKRAKRATPKRRNPPYPDAERDRMKSLSAAAKRRARLKAEKLHSKHPGTSKQLSHHGLNKYSVQFFDKSGRLIADYNL